MMPFEIRPTDDTTFAVTGTPRVGWRVAVEAENTCATSCQVIGRRAPDSSETDHDRVEESRHETSRYS